MRKRKTEAIQTDLDTFRHNQAYPGITQAYSGISRALCNSGIFRTMVYLEPWHILNQKHIRNPGILRGLGYSKSEIYSGPCQTSTIRVLRKLSLFPPRIFTNHNYFHSINLPRTLLHQTNHRIFLMQV